MYNIIIYTHPLIAVISLSATRRRCLNCSVFVLPGSAPPLSRTSLTRLFPSPSPSSARLVRPASICTAAGRRKTARFTSVLRFLFLSERTQRTYIAQQATTYLAGWPEGDVPSELPASPVAACPSCRMPVSSPASSAPLFPASLSDMVLSATVTPSPSDSSANECAPRALASCSNSPMLGF